MSKRLLRYFIVAIMPCAVLVQLSGLCYVFLWLLGAHR